MLEEEVRISEQDGGNHNTYNAYTDKDEQALAGKNDHNGHHDVEANKSGGSAEQAQTQNNGVHAENT